jgi:hypothetical protein
MSPDKQNIAIAEACGYTGVRMWTRFGSSSLVGHLGSNSFAEVPDYLNDLNAMHEAEKTLTYAQGGEMTIWIQRMTCAGYGPQLFATAAQRAEAFLRTVGKWEDDK